MGELPVPQDFAGSIDASSISKKKKKPVIGGPMNLEEQRMNKDILREISQMKK